MERQQIEIKLLSLSDKSASFSFVTQRIEVLDVYLNNRLVKQIQQADLGRFVLDELQPQTSYSLQLKSENGEISNSVIFSTFEEPVGECLSHFALISDPHISSNLYNRKGRYFVESALIFQDTLNICNTLGVDFVAIPGDLCDNKKSEELELALKTLKNSNLAYGVVPGNHDLGDEVSKDTWNEKISETEGVFSFGSTKIIGLDTANGSLSAKGISLIEEGLKSEQGFLYIITHYQLFDNPYICRGGNQKVISNGADCKNILNKLSNRDNTIIYCGHQNIPSVVHINRAIQLNLPQPTQYPCGFIEVNEYVNGVYHTFRPITSEILRQSSRQNCNRAIEYYNENQWCANYRDGDEKARNFFIKREVSDA